MSFVIFSLLKLVENYGLIMRYNGPMNIRQVEKFFIDKKYALPANKATY